MNPAKLAELLPHATGDLQIQIYEYDLDCWEGTRAQLEAEGLIPPGLQWPEGFARASWEAGGWSYWLARQKPAHARGHKFAWLHVDNWSLGRRLGGPMVNFAETSIRSKYREFTETLREWSPEGQRARAAMFERYWRAHEDKAFQQFKELFVPAPRKRRAGQAAG